MPPKVGKEAASLPNSPDTKEQDAAGVDEDAGELRHQSLVASTFANVELQSTKATLAQYVSLYNAAREDVGKLTSELQERDRDAMTVVQFLRNDLEARQDQIKELKKKIDEDVTAAKLEAEAEKDALRADIEARDAELTGLHERNGQLEADLEALHAFRRERETMHHELGRLHDEHTSSVEKYEAELSKQRFLSLEEKVRLKAEERTMQSRFDAEVNARAMKLLDAKTKEINAENFMLLKDKAMLERELQHANAGLATATAQHAEQRRESELSRIADAEHMKRSVTKAREGKELQLRCEEMEVSLARTVREYDAKMSTMRARHEKEAAQLTRERDDAVRTAELIQRDYLKMRKLTRSVVQQRTELETFFTESLDFVKTEIARERRQLMPTAAGGASRSAAAAGGSLKAITAGAGRPLPQVTAGSQPPYVPAKTLPNLAVNSSSSSKAAGNAARGGAARAARKAQKEQELRAGEGHGSLPTGTSTSSVRAADAAASQEEHGFFAQGSTFEALGGTPKPPGHNGPSPPAVEPQQVRSALPPIGGGQRAGSSAAASQQQQQQQQFSDPEVPPGAMVATQPVEGATPLPGGGGDGRVDIAELSWADKERVLRILFARINTVSNSNHPRQAAPAASSRDSHRHSHAAPAAIEQGGPHHGNGVTAFMTQHSP